MTGIAKPAHQNIFGKVVELEKHSIIVDETANLIEGLRLLQSDESRQRSYAIKDEICLEILQSDLGELRLFLILVEPNELKYYIDGKTRIHKKLKGIKYFGSFREHNDSWSHEKGVNGEGIGDDAPKLWQWILLPNDPPFPFVL